MTFDALGVSPDLAAALADAGIVDPFPVQSLCIPDALAGRDVCGMAQTGSGKTLAFGIPLIERVGAARPGRPRALVLVPTRELALQVAAVIAPLAALRDIRVKAVYGGTPLDRQIESLRTKPVSIMVATPGRLIDLMERGTVSLDAIRRVVLDEADRLADMGFTPQVEWILRRIPKPHQTMLFSATLEGEVDALVRHHMRKPRHHGVDPDVKTVEQMTHCFFSVHQMDKVKVAATIARHSGKVLLFVRTKRGADRLVRQLEDEGVVCGAIHGGLNQSRRERQLHDFSTGRTPILVATDVAARGLHVEAVDVVIHYDPAQDHTAYVHRSGRTARAGVAGTAVTLVLWDQIEDVLRTQRRLNLDEPIIEVFSNDRRLADLVGFATAAG